MKRLLSTMVVGLAGIQVMTLEASTRPKLVVGIIVDQLRTDYLENLQDKFGSGGFRLLMDKGAFFKDVEFNVPVLDEASATAIIQTGTYPRQNGIPSAEIYNPSTKSLVSVFHDPDYIGNFTTETYSPSSLGVTTLTDEIAVEGKGKSLVHSIGPNAEGVIILAGHAGNSAFWINDNTGKWATSTYYKNPPAPLQNRNYNSPLVNRLDTMRWRPLKSGEYYIDIPEEKLEEGFRYTFPRSDRDVFSLYKQSPYVNSDITDAATEYISGLNFGANREVMDVLNLTYTVAPYPSVKSGDGKYEIEDSYLRLDQDLSRLFKALDNHFGLDNVLVYVASTGYTTEPERETELFRLPSGSFSVKRAISLLNAFLSAKYGNASYVDQYSRGHIYLDHASIELKNLDVAKIAEESRDFLVRMSGVADAYTVSDLQSPSVSRLEGHRLSIDPKISGDIILEFTPGWKVTDDTRYPAETQKNLTTAYPAPAFILSPEVSAQVIESPVEAVSIAPTVANILRIRSPNAAIAKALKL